MPQKNYLKGVLVGALALLAAGGLLLHTRTHPAAGDPTNLIPLIAGLPGLLLIPWLFLSRKTIHLAYVLNGMLAIVGTITMAHFSIANLPEKWNLTNIFFRTTLADILLLWGKFFVGRAIFLLEFYSPETPYNPGWKVFRYPHLGWWAVHLIALSLVYWLGNLIWR